MPEFIIDDAVKCVLDELRRLAEKDERVLSLATLRQHAEGFDPEDPSTRCSPYPLDQTIGLPLGWKVTMSLEYQPYGISRHMSMSSPTVGCLPSLEAAQWVMIALGFVRPLEGCIVYKEQYETGRHAINVIEPVDPTFDLTTLGAEE